MTLAQRRRGEFPPTRDMPTPDVRLYHRAVVVAQDVQGQLRGLVRQLSIDQFENESRRVSMGAGASEASTVRNKTPLFERTFSEPVGGRGAGWLGTGWLRAGPGTADFRLAAAAVLLPLCCHTCRLARLPDSSSPACRAPSTRPHFTPAGHPQGGAARVPQPPPLVALGRP